MVPYFETVKSFADVPFTKDGGTSGVDTKSFLDAADGLILIFDLFDAIVFGFIQLTLRQNLNAVRIRYENNIGRSKTLEDLARSEREDGRRKATPCLVRVLRGLALTQRALEKMQRDPHAQPRVCFRQSYDAVMLPHHCRIVQHVVHLAILSVPSRSSFYACITQNGCPEKLGVELDKWLLGLNKIVVHMSDWLKNGGYGYVS
ncbi:glycolipid transfer protein [Panaeolus papilionaceus]|nr:glycolipid transfer protein [Panaeolus papilionaceus]